MEFHNIITVLQLHILPNSSTIITSPHVSSLQYSSRSILTLSLSSSETSPKMISSKQILAYIPLSIFIPSYPFPVIAGSTFFIEADPSDVRMD